MKNKRQIKTVTINRLAFATYVFASCSAIIVLVAVLIWMYTSGNKEEITVSYVIEKSNEALLEYPYGRVSILRNMDSADGQHYESQYDLSSQRDGQYSSYMFRDSDGQQLYQCWQPNEDFWDIWVYDGNYDVWVKTGYEQEPIDSSMWSPLTNPGSYVLLDKTYSWYDTGEECYVIQMLGSSDQWTKIYEEMFFSKKTFLPVGVVMIATNSTEEIDHEYVEENVTFDDGTVGDLHVGMYKYDKIVQKYSITYSDTDQRLFEIPDITITEDEYMELLNSDGKDGVDNE